MSEMTITEGMASVRESLHDYLAANPVPHDVVSGVADHLAGMTSTLGLSDSQRGWMILAVANLLAGVALANGSGIDRDTEETVRYAVGQLTDLLAAVGDRIITNDELPTL